MIDVTVDHNWLCTDLAILNWDPIKQVLLNQYVAAIHNLTLWEYMDAWLMQRYDGAQLRVRVNLSRSVIAEGIRFHNMDSKLMFVLENL
jgi:hypothetical protein